MQFAIVAYDKDTSQETRQQRYPDHQAFLANAGKWNVTIIVSGPLVQDDGNTAIGSLFVIEAPDRQTAEQFHQADPFFSTVWDKSTITAFVRKR